MRGSQVGLCGKCGQTNLGYGSAVLLPERLRDLLLGLYEVCKVLAEPTFTNRCMALLTGCSRRTEGYLDVTKSLV